MGYTTNGGPQLACVLELGKNSRLRTIAHYANEYNVDTFLCESIFIAIIWSFSGMNVKIFRNTHETPMIGKRFAADGHIL